MAGTGQMNYDQLADTIIELVGGRANVNSMTHCVTRLRFNLTNTEKVKAEELKKLEGVLGVVYQFGQYQIVLGNKIMPIFENLSSRYGISTTETVNEPVQKNKLTVYGATITVFSYIASSVSPFITVLELFKNFGF
jgi:PTS system beta-glucosides-specific IIC component